MTSSIAWSIEPPNRQLLGHAVLVMTGSSFVTQGLLSVGTYGSEGGGLSAMAAQSAETADSYGMFMVRLVQLYACS